MYSSHANQFGIDLINYVQTCCLVTIKCSTILCCTGRDIRLQRLRKIGNAETDGHECFYTYLLQRLTWPFELQLNEF